MRKALKVIVPIVAAIVIAALIVGYRYLSSIAPIGTGYAAKILCSSVYVSGRDYESVMNEDLEIIGDFKIKAWLDQEGRAAEASMLGLFKKRALYREGLGCTLVIGVEDDELLEQADGVHYSPPGKIELPWPQGDLTSGEIPQDIDKAKLTAAVDKAFTEVPDQGPRRTRAVVVLYKGEIVAERYGPGITKDTPLLGWSMTKSVINALVGILVGQGELDLDAPAPVPEWQGPDDPRRKITLDQLLRMESGLAFIEEYEENIDSDCNNMLFNTPDTAGFAAAMPLEAEPGSRWSYSSGSANILARIVRGASGTSRAAQFDFPRRALFERIGMSSAIIEPDPSGTFVVSSFMYATARDWARFGLLYLNDGVWMGERILPDGWVTYSTTPTPHAPPAEAYGALFWLNAGNATRWIPELPEDMFSASGHEGQYVMVIPSRDVVVVRLGLTRGPSTREVLSFVADILNALPGSKG
ncbi:MAG: serine hydrolase [Deltaproteobacteria bacterium]|nr:serine hydrolase [Deltaproteobacteria bacterium]